MAVDLSPLFTVGARVAVSQGYRGADWSEATVERLFQSGHVAITGFPGVKWRTFNADAHPVGDAHRYSTLSATVFTDEAAPRLSAAILATKLNARRGVLVRRLERMPRESLTEDLIGAIETAVAKVPA